MNLIHARKKQKAAQLVASPNGRRRSERQEKGSNTAVTGGQDNVVPEPIGQKVKPPMIEDVNEDLEEDGEDDEDEDDVDELSDDDIAATVIASKKPKSRQSSHIPKTTTVFAHPKTTKKSKSTKPKQPKSSEEANGSEEEGRYAVM
jgi:hypothetical protein